jgi:hypothetical protein
MKVRIELAEKNDPAINRVRNALKAYAPDHMLFDDNPREFDVDLLVMMVNGRNGRTKRRIAKAKTYNADIAIMQISLISTRNPLVEDWMTIWDDAKLIWSYYDLPEIARQQGIEPTFSDKFYRSPLGADSKVFKPSGAEKEYLAIAVTKGYFAESTREILTAVNHVGAKAVYVGKHIDELHDGIDQFENITDEELADLYSKSYYVCALRRREGQDLPAAEGLLCGARPVVFDRPDQADWSQSFITIPEINEERIISDLIEIFQGKYNPVTGSEIERAKESFSWRAFAEGFWSRI